MTDDRIKALWNKGVQLMAEQFEYVIEKCIAEKSSVDKKPLDDAVK